ncbi:MAG: PP2C family protein-serine/threonine phosphatase [Tepidisphaerales bacterium]
MTVLVIEDEPDLLRVVARSLREAGYAVDLAADGLVGLSMAEAGDYGMIVLDIMLPKMDGFTVLRELRRARTTPVLILTARDAVADRVEGLDAGADDYLTKPFEMAEFLARVRALIRRDAGGAVALEAGGEVTADSLARTVSRLDLARRIQMRLMPSQSPRIPGLDMAFHYQPAQWIGGDYCDFWRLQDGRLAFVVADVMGKGLAAAMVMANLHATLHASMAFCANGARAIEYVNQHLADHLPEGLFVTLFLGLLDVRTGRLEYVNAGHVPPLLMERGTGIQPLGSPDNTVLGIGRGPFSSETVTLAPDAVVLLMTDGISESASPEGELFGTKRAAEVMRSAASAGAQHLVQQLTETASRFRGAGPQQDDITVLAVRRLGGQTGILPGVMATEVTQ